MDESSVTLAATPIMRDVVIVEGADALSYLQTQLTQDVERLPLGGSAWSFILDPKSSIEALVRATRFGTNRVALDVDPGFGHVVRERLDGLLFRTDARFSEDTWPGVSWRGPAAASRKQDAPIVSLSKWHGVEGIDIVGPDVAVPAGAPMRTHDELEALRIRSGWPTMGYELGPGIQPAMTGLVGVAVSFEKGCYTGQELVARTYHRGAAPTKRLVRLTSDDAFERGVRLMLGGDDVGEVTSVAGGNGLGYLARKVETPAQLGANGRTVTAHDIADG